MTVLANNAEGVGYCRPPVHTRFRPGVSGNPSGRPKGNQNFSTLFRRILKEEVSLREGSAVRKVTKAEAILRGLVVGAMKGDSRSLAALLRLAEQTGHLDEPPHQAFMTVQRVIVDARTHRLPDTDETIPAIRQLSSHSGDPA
jgi:hypothetical protein